LSWLAVFEPVAQAVKASTPAARAVEASHACQRGVDDRAGGDAGRQGKGGRLGVLMAMHLRSVVTPGQLTLVKTGGLVT
jgi:hypothetical protein